MIVPVTLMVILLVTLKVFVFVLENIYIVEKLKCNFIKVYPICNEITYTYVLNTYIGTFFLLHARVMMNHVTCLLLFTYNFLSFPIGF